MHCVVDENIPYGREAFSTLGEVLTVPGRELRPETVRGAEVLCVRSVSKVSPELLEGSGVRFVGTATIGTDHVDLEYLKARGIGFASAPGSNARSVAEYLTAALLHVFAARGARLRGAVLGIVGVGNVGSRVAEKARALGMKVLLNDPPRAEREGGAGFTELAELLPAADVVTVHVPLEHGGRHPTFHLAGEKFLESLKPGALFVNTSRGAVHDTAALLRALDNRLGGAVLDVWEDEPLIDKTLAGRVLLSTPHIAGYSFDGKVAGTRMIFEAACRFLGRPPTWPRSIRLPEPAVPLVEECVTDENGAVRSTEDLLRSAAAKVYDIRADDAALRETLRSADGERGPAFDRLRKNYRVRREFFNTAVKFVVPKELPPLVRKEALGTVRKASKIAADLGFRTAGE